MAIKAQALANFIAEFTSLELKDSLKELALWTIHTYGSSTQKKGGAGVVITSLEEDTLKYEVQLNFPITNNEAKYKAILTRLKITQALGAKTALLKSD